MIDDTDRVGRPLIPINYLTPYCRRRPLSDDDINQTQGYIQNTYTFKSLRSQGFKSEDLLQWSASIDIIEQYAIYLNKSDTTLDEFIFNNCSSFWFGSNCQYTFGLNISIQSFGDFLNSSMKNRKQYEMKIITHTCYPYLSGCYRGPKPMCLDWREICNGKIDCIDGDFGIDEKYCDELEIKECEQNEYRCHNGAQCIPLDFFRDGWTHRDCLDGTDEEEKFNPFETDPSTSFLYCIDMMIFACEETTCRYPRSFSCGDGQCLQGHPVFNIVDRQRHSCRGTGRDIYYSQAIAMSAKQYPDDCYKLLFCKLKFYFFLKNDTYNEKDCLSTNWKSSNNCTLDYLSYPLKPLLYGYFQPMYSTKRLLDNRDYNIRPSYFCNDRRLCLHLGQATSQRDGLDCRMLYLITPQADLEYDLRNESAVCELMGNIHNYTSTSSLFYCNQSRRYISKHRLIDGIMDCHSNEDETYKDSCLLNDTQRISCTSENKCLSPIGIDVLDCIGREDMNIRNRQLSVFPRLCNLIPDLESSDNEIYETNCEWWPCDTPYNRCDGYYHCANGIDELNCPNINCKFNEYKCYINDSDNYHCIPQEYIYEIPLTCNINDSSSLCRHLFYSNSSNININNQYISWKEKSCITKNDICGYQSNNDQQQLCHLIKFSGIPFCSSFFPNLDSNHILCHFITFGFETFAFHVSSVWNLGYLPSTINTTLLSTQQLIDRKAGETLSINTSIELIEYCNRGIVLFEGKSYEKKCLCPPNYFGNQCQWQNQRVSLTLQIRTLGSYEEIFSTYVIFLYLIDDQNQIIHSYDEIHYITSIDCDTKYNRYLLYPNQPKNSNYTYSIHIDAYDKLTLSYYASWYLFIPFPFLPVNRIATQIQIPFKRSQPLTNCLIDCGNHGKCYSYVNLIKSFCHCEQGYSGRFCNLTYDISCSSDSIPLNSSICLCPSNKFGSKCYLEHQSCQSDNNPCKNHGRCLPMNDRINRNGFICLCNEDYMGSYCEYKANRIDITFKTDHIPSLIFAHFITAFNDRDHQRTTKFKKVPFDQDTISIFIKQPFHILFINFSNDYYLTVLRQNFIPNEHISTNITMDHMCINITKFLNSTLLSYSKLRRMKYYPLQCFQNPKLFCFYDEEYICVCDKTRFSNCFTFNHTLSDNCQQNNSCNNHGKCFQDNIKCPTMAICMCDKCYYGSECHLTTEGFSISLDVILGYHIKSSLSFTEQSKVVKITSSLTILMFIFGVFNGLSSILTFRKQSLLQVGCGIYLLTNSVISLLILSIFTIKYIELIIFQMNITTNRSFISLSCKIIDVLLKTLLSYGDWLNACVAIERAFTLMQGVHFNKTRSIYLAKRVIFLILFLTIISYIHDPISRELFDDKDEERTWCIVRYSLRLKIYDKFINLFHFITPFAINILSAVIIITQVYRVRTKTRKKKQTNRRVLYNQIQQHKHLFISPCILILLAIPRLIILLFSQCMKSARDPWLFLVGYYISFVPPLLTIIVYILPSETYKEQFFSIFQKSPSNLR